MGTGSAVCAPVNQEARRTMANIELQRSWAVTLRHLAACRYHLSETLGSAEALRIERDFIGFLHNNEFGIALECAEELGRLNDAPHEFWVELRMAAETMGHKAEAERYAQLSSA
jgi:plasmid maintenance system antidote protein VapI